MNKSKLTTVVVSILGLVVLGAALFFFLRKDPYVATAREVTVGVELLGREYSASGMTFGAMITQTEISKRNFDSLLLKLPAPSSDNDREKEKLIKEYILSASNVAYTLGRHLNAHMQLEIAQKNTSSASDTSVCGSNYASFAMTACLLNVQGRQLEAFARVDSARTIKRTAESDKKSALSKFQSARQNIDKAGYDVDVKNINVISQLERNL
jgi:hypothetical protein